MLQNFMVSELTKGKILNYNYKDSTYELFFDLSAKITRCDNYFRSQGK